MDERENKGNARLPYILTAHCKQTVSLSFKVKQEQVPLYVMIKHC